MQITEPIILHFRHFSRKGYAVFASLHRLVTIGRICPSLTDLQQIKSRRQTCLVLPQWTGYFLLRTDSDPPQE